MGGTRAAWLACVAGVMAGAFVCGCSFKSGKIGSGTRDDATVDPDGNGGDGPVDTSPDTPPPSSPRRLVFDNSASTVNFAEIQVLVPLTPTSVDYAAVTDPKTDLRFEDELTASDIPFEVESWVPGGESIVWIRVPSIPAGSTTTSVLMHFGPTAAGSADANATWQDFTLVHHFATTDSSVDASYKATFTGATMAPGKIGPAATFTASSHRVAFAASGSLFDNWAAYVLSFWLYLDYNDANLASEPDVIDKGGPLQLGRILHPGNTELRIQIDLHFTGGAANTAYLNTNVPLKTWTHITYGFNGDMVGLLENGVLGPTQNMLGGTQTSTTGTQMVSLGDASDAFHGQIDELRIEERFRTVDYVRAQYLIMNRQFVTFTDP